MTSLQVTQSTETTAVRRATSYRMVMDRHICPYGLKAKDLLQRQGFEVEDHWLTTPAQTDQFKSEHHVATTPQVFIEGRRIGGYDELRLYLGEHVADPNTPSYRPV